jgi:hypothetical protein
MIDQYHNHLREWNLTLDELNEILVLNPSLRGITFGYVAEFKLRKIWFSSQHFSSVQKYDDHDRTRKGDLAFIYKGTEILVESKSLQTNSIKEIEGTFKGTFQCDASDRRDVLLPNDEIVTTTCLKRGEFDLLAVNLFNFKKEWLFAFAKNIDLPSSSSRKYTDYQKQFLLSTSMKISFPLEPPFTYEPFSLLDDLVKEKNR